MHNAVQYCGQLLVCRMLCSEQLESSVYRVWHVWHMWQLSYMSTAKYLPMKHCKQLNTESSHYVGCNKKVMRNRPSSTVKTEPVDCRYALWSLFSTLEGWEVLWSSCLYVCLSVRSVCWQSYIISQERHVKISQNFLWMLPVTVAQSFADDNALCCVFPVLWMMLCFHVMAEIQVRPWPDYSASLARWRHFETAL